MIKLTDRFFQTIRLSGRILRCQKVKGNILEYASQVVISLSRNLHIKHHRP